MSKNIVINPGWPQYEKYTFVPAIKRGNLLFITGQDGSQRDPATGEKVISADIVEQTKVIYEKLKAILEAAGASFDDVVWTTDYITTLDNYKGTAEVRRQYFGDNFPAATAIVVSGLVGGRKALIEVEAVAVLD